MTEDHGRITLCADLPSRAKGGQCGKICDPLTVRHWCSRIVKQRDGYTSIPRTGENSRTKSFTRSAGRDNLRTSVRWASARHGAASHMSDPQPAGIKASKRSAPEPISDRTAYLMRGAVLGFAIGVGMLIATRGDAGPGTPWFLVAATVVGSVAGLDLYLTRRWRRFGRFRATIRFTVACTGAAGVTSAVGVLLHLIPWQLAWSFTAFGVIGGLLHAIYVFGTAD